MASVATTVSAPAVERRLMRTSAAARYLGIGAKALRALIVRGELPYVQLQPGNSPFLVDIRDLEMFIEIRKRRA